MSAVWKGQKRYLGDGVYIDFDGFALVLTTEDGISVTNRIVLEEEVYAGIGAFLLHIKGLVDAEAGVA